MLRVASKYKRKSSTHTPQKTRKRSMGFIGVLYSCNFTFVAYVVAGGGSVEAHGFKASMAYQSSRARVGLLKTKKCGTFGILFIFGGGGCVVHAAQRW